jgi:purine-binding chemotaxis protein CheW
VSAPVGLTLIQMGGRPCAIPCTDIVELVPRVMLSSVPDAPKDVLGVINVRGRVVPVIDVRHKFVDEPGRGMPPFQHLVIVAVGDRQYGVVVDEVVDVVQVEPDAIERFGEIAGSGRARPGVARIGDAIVLVLEPHMVIHAS